MFDNIPLHSTVDAPEGGGAVNSPVVSVTIDPLNHNHFSSPVVLVLEHSKVGLLCAIGVLIAYGQRDSRRQTLYVRL